MPRGVVDPDKFLDSVRKQRASLAARRDRLVNGRKAADELINGQEAWLEKANENREKAHNAVDAKYDKMIERREAQIEKARGGNDEEIDAELVRLNSLIERQDKVLEGEEVQDPIDEDETVTA